MEVLQRDANDYEFGNLTQQKGASAFASYDGYTPLHFACMREDLTKEEFLLGIDDINEEERIYINEEERIGIIKLLLDKGVSIKYDPYELSPPEVAALSRMKDVVGFFLWHYPHTPVKVKIRAAEILGVSQAIHESDPNFEDVFSSFSWVFELRKEADLLDEQRGNSKLVQCFSEISLEECCTANDLERVESGRLDAVSGIQVREFEVGMKAHAFLIGDRSYPEDFKKWFFYPFLVRFAKDLFNITQWNEGFKVLDFVLGLERSGQLKLGVVAPFLAKGWRPFARMDQLQHARGLLGAYESVLTDVSINHLTSRSDSLMESFCIILYDEAFHCATSGDLKSTLLAIEKLLRVVRSRIRTEEPSEYPNLSSVTFKIMERLAGNWSLELDPSSLYRVKYVMLNALFSDSATYVDSRGQTLLHLVTHCYSPENLDYLQDLARNFVRHGCPIDVENDEGKTASRLLEEDQMYDHESDPKSLMLVSPPTTVLRLEEEAIRAVLRHHINYQGILPSHLCEMIEDGVEEYDIHVGRGSEDSENGSEESEIGSEDSEIWSDDSEIGSVDSEIGSEDSEIGSEWWPSVDSSSEDEE